MTKPARVLIVAREDDLSADLVMANLESESVIRIDPAHLQDRYMLSAYMDGAGSWAAEFRSPSTTLTITRETAVYWRKPTRPESLSTDDARWVLEEHTMTIKGLLRAIGPRIMINDPFANDVARLKPFQITMALQSGFAVPATLLTNRPEDAERFRREHRGIVVKALTQLYTDMIPTTRVEATQDLSGVVDHVHQFQRGIAKRYDVRLTAVGTRLFAVRVTTSGRHLDWRTSDRKGLSYSPIDVPPDVQHATDRYMRNLGLQYAAFDFAVDRKGKWWFLEANPNGEFGFIESETEYPLSWSIAQHLLARAPLPGGAIAVVCKVCGEDVPFGPLGGYVCGKCFYVEEPPAAAEGRMLRNKRRARAAAAADAGLDLEAPDAGR
jgi:glutathione synthase/RimK-type ligase-like ATP-grasp enzyme